MFKFEHEKIEERIEQYEHEIAVETGFEKFWQKPESNSFERAWNSIRSENEYFNGQPKIITSFERNQAQIGKSIGREHFLAQMVRRRQLKEQSIDITRRMERCGIDGTTNRNNISFVDLVTGENETLPDYRNTNFIPSVQSRNIHDMLLHVQHDIEKADAKKIRMLVISAGWIPLNEYREHHKAHTRRMSKYAHAIRKEFGIEMLYYNVEMTIHRNDKGQVMLNGHSHALAEIAKRLPKKRWNEFLSFSRNFFPKGYVHDSPVKKAVEVVKYVFKPTEFELLSDDEFTTLFYQIQGQPYDLETGEILHNKSLKFFHPLGRIRALRRSLKLQGKKLLRVSLEEGKSEWRTTERRIRDKDGSSNSSRTSNVAVAITAPLPYFSPRRRPCVVVQGWNGDFAALIKENNLEDIRREAIGHYERSIKEENSLIKDTTTTTVQELGSVSDVIPPQYRNYQEKPDYWINGNHEIPNNSGFGTPTHPETGSKPKSDFRIQNFAQNSETWELPNPVPQREIRNFPYSENPGSLEYEIRDNPGSRDNINPSKPSKLG